MVSAANKGDGLSQSELTRIVFYGGRERYAVWIKGAINPLDDNDTWRLTERQCSGSNAWIVAEHLHGNNGLIVTARLRR